MQVNVAILMLRLSRMLQAAPADLCRWVARVAMASLERVATLNAPFGLNIGDATCRNLRRACGRADNRSRRSIRGRPNPSFQVSRDSSFVNLRGPFDVGPDCATT